jgi:hypothetical protein
MRHAVPLALAALLVAPSVASAHKMIVVAKVTERVRVEVGYEDKTPAEDAKVTIKDETGTVVAEGVTDANGVCVLPRPKPGTYALIANDGGGHRRQEQLVISDEQATVEARTTLSNRWVTSVIGVAVIGGVTLLVWWLRTRR